MPHQKTHDFLSGRWARDSQDSAEVLQMQFFSVSVSRYRAHGK